MADVVADDEQPRKRPSPVPRLQLLMLAVIVLAEQIAFNSVGPYLPDMVLSFSGVNEGDVGLAVGILATAFGFAQLATNFFWGWASDRVGRKPVLLLGTALTALAFVAFGLCTRLWMAVVVQVLMGIVNGNGAVVNTVMGEITDKSNQGDSFKWLPVVYGAGSLIGPLVGGGLANVYGTDPSTGRFGAFPYLLPNVVVASILGLDFLLVFIFLRESRADIRPLSSLWHPLARIISRRPKPRSHEDSERSSLLSHAHEHSRSRSPSPAPASDLTLRALLTAPVLSLLTSYFIFNLSIVAYATMYPTFAALHPPTGRGLTPSQIGASLSFASLASMLFQACVFSRIQARLGAAAGLRTALVLFALAFLFTPYIPYIPSATPSLASAPSGLPALLLFWSSLSFVLLLRTIATVLGLTLLMLLITNAAPSPASLGALNGLAQTLAAAGRALGPFASGGLYSLATKRLRGRGELAWLVFAGVAALGFVVSWGITGERIQTASDVDADAYDRSGHRREDEEQLGEER